MTTVYLIDDEPELLELLCDVVTLVGLTPRGFNRASFFFDKVTLFETGSILVLDLHMPEMDGIEVMRRLAQMTDPPALLLISGQDSGVLHAAEKLGRAHGLEILASVAKPVPIEQFRQLLQQHNPDRDKDRLGNTPSDELEIFAIELHQAIRSDQMVLHYQPQIEIATGALTGVEALVRWQHPEQGLIYPDRLIPIAEQHGLMGALTHWVIGKVVQQGQQWRNAGLPVAVSANISSYDITSLTLPEQLAELLADKKLDPTRLTLEVTESALMGELVTALDILTRLRLKGIGLSIDDFGTGYSSLSQLHRVPFTELKIDRSFVANMTVDNEALAIVKTCILLGHELNMLVVAEGVEDQQSWDHLADLGCDLAQGYFIAKPMPSGKLLAWVASRG
ncbi:MAG: EAL domain-containing response regulator [Gammaproteobacteria bacterium]|nr:EAL domain-containing response regulator [Gammaproteobacteria bacterium]